MFCKHVILLLSTRPAQPVNDYFGNEMECYGYYDTVTWIYGLGRRRDGVPIQKAQSDRTEQNDL